VRDRPYPESREKVWRDVGRQESAGICVRLPLTEHHVGPYAPMLGEFSCHRSRRTRPAALSAGREKQDIQLCAQQLDRIQPHSHPLKDPVHTGRKVAREDRRNEEHARRHLTRPSRHRERPLRGRPGRRRRAGPLGTSEPGRRRATAFPRASPRRSSAVFHGDLRCRVLATRRLVRPTDGHRSSRRCQASKTDGSVNGGALPRGRAFHEPSVL
jgi:hypothetical protein